MKDDFQKIYDTYSDIQEKWSAEYNVPNILFDLHGSHKYILKYTVLFETIHMHYESLNRVTIMASADPIALCYLLKKFYNSKITIVSDHPLLDRVGNFFREEYGAEVVDLNPMFDDCSEYIKDADLVIFPEFEYFAPLSMIKYYDKEVETLVIYYIEIANNNNMRQMILSEHELEEKCDFKEVKESGKFKNVDNRNVFYSIGVR
jgi:hypothetical protein